MSNEAATGKQEPVEPMKPRRTQEGRREEWPSEEWRREEWRREQKQRKVDLEAGRDGTPNTSQG
jgi:hypothetical protein